MGYDMRTSRQRRHTWVRVIRSNAERWVTWGHATSQMRMNISEGNRDIGVFSFFAVEASRVASARDTVSLSRSAISWNGTESIGRDPLGP